MNRRLFDQFMASGDTLRVYDGTALVFASGKDRLLALLEYIDGVAAHKGVAIFDRVVGNAAALLSIKAGCKEVCSPLGSELAVNTLGKYGIACSFTRLVPCIQRPDGEDMCPMEKLSLGKSPQEFYEALKQRTAMPQK